MLNAQQVYAERAEQQSRQAEALEAEAASLDNDACALEDEGEHAAAHAQRKLACARLVAAQTARRQV